MIKKNHYLLVISSVVMIFYWIDLQIFQSNEKERQVQK